MPNFSEKYTFTVRSGSAINLQVGNGRIIDVRGSGPVVESTGTIDLKAGQRYNFRLDVNHQSGPLVLQVKWQSASQPLEVLPGSQLFPSGDAAAPAGSLSREFNGPGGKLKDVSADLPELNFSNADAANTGVMIKQAFHWPASVRRYSYRHDGELPSGSAPNHDNVQIAFNVLPEEAKNHYPFPPGTMKGFIAYSDTDYEYALNQVAPQYGGGTEIWRLNVPGMPHKHFYPRQPASPFDGPAQGGQLSMTRDATTRIVEAAIPWSEIPDVKARLDNGQTIKFSFRVNDNGNPVCMELAKNRSVSKRNNITFHNDWNEHWANELEFAFER